MTIDDIDDKVAAAAFRRLVRHLQHRDDAQNVDLMGLAGFCRNCLSDWIADAAGGSIDKDAARDAVYAMRTDDGVVIQVRNRGMRSGPPEIMAALARGERIDPNSIYFRAAPELVAPAGRYEWLNRALFLCTGERWADGIRLWVWKVV